MIGNCTDASSVRDVSDVARFNASDTCGERSLFFRTRFIVNSNCDDIVSDETECIDTPM